MNCKNIKTKRIYLPPTNTDGYRVLVDRLWPRGLKKETVQINLWLKEIAPSNELRKWFNHDPEKWLDFKKHYFKELAKKQELLQAITKQPNTKTITLLYGAKNEKYNHANVLREFLNNRIHN